VIDHPVCGAAVAAQLFIDAAASPPLQGGENAQLMPFAALKLSARLALNYVADFRDTTLATRADFCRPFFLVKRPLQL